MAANYNLHPKTLRELLIQFGPQLGAQRVGQKLRAEKTDKMDIASC